MNNNFVLSLVRKRIEHAARMNGATPGEAAIFAEQRIANEGLTKLTGKLKLQGTPEAGIATICETYWTLVYRQIQANPVCEELKPRSELKTQLLRHFGRNALREIERFRSRFYPGHEGYPEDLNEYIAWRMEGEMKSIHGVGIEAFGYSPSFLEQTCDACSIHVKAALLAR